jgi:hypothetical protein
MRFGHPGILANRDFLGVFAWWRVLHNTVDLNQRPSGYEPDCETAIALKVKLYGIKNINV